MKAQNSPLTYILIGIAIILLIQFLTSNDQPSTPASIPTAIPTVIPTVDSDECITWQEAEYHDGENVCVRGEVVLVKSVFDEETGETIWSAYFSLEENTFHLISVGESLDEWQGKCVVVRGTLSDRRFGPSMMNSVEYFGSFFTISAPPFCGQNPFN